MTGQENFQALVKQKTEEMRQWQQELEEREQQQEADYRLLDKKITELEEFDKYLKTWEVNLKSKERAWNKQKKLETENFTRELLSAKKKLENQIEVLEDRHTTLKCEKDELLKEQLELFEKLDVLEEKIHDEELRLDDMFYERRSELSAKEERQKKEEENLSFKKKQLDYEEQSTKALLKKLWGIWIFWIVVAIVSAFISIFFVHGYLASDNRALNTYNKTLSSYNTSIEKLNDQITDKQTRLASKEEIWITYDCDNNDYGESMCPETKIASLKSQIDDLEHQKKELVKPQEPTL